MRSSTPLRPDKVAQSMMLGGGDQATDSKMEQSLHQFLTDRDEREEFDEEDDMAIVSGLPSPAVGARIQTPAADNEHELSNILS